MQKKSSKKTAQGTNKNTKRVVWSILLLLLLCTAAWALWTPGKDPQIAKIEEMRAKMEDAPREQRREMWGELREEIHKLPPEARQALFAERRKEWQQRERDRMGEFFAMSYAEQIAVIDKDIDRQNERRKRWAERQAAEGQQPNAQSQNGGDGGRGGRGWGGGTPEDRLQRQKSYLDQTTPIEREQRSQYRQLQQQRRAQRGL